LRIRFLAAIRALIASCALIASPFHASAQDQAPVQTDRYGGSVSAQISPLGGTLDDSDHGAKLVFPFLSLDRTHLITLQTASSPGAPLADQRLSLGFFNVIATDDKGTSRQHSLLPWRMDLTYNGVCESSVLCATVPINEATLRCERLKSDGGGWDPIVTLINPVSRQLYCYSKDFTTYAVSAKALETSGIADAQPQYLPFVSR
jgi:hypothetical protein